MLLHLSKADIYQIIKIKAIEEFEQFKLHRLLEFTSKTGMCGE